MKNLAFVFWLVALPTLLHAGQRTIKGTVLDRGTGEKVSGALIYFQNQFTTSDENGYFELQWENTRAKNIIVSHLGFEPYEGLIREFDGQTMTIELSSSIHMLEEVLISAESRPATSQRRIGRSAIMRTNPKNVGDVFADKAGFGIIKRGGYAMEPVFRSFKYEQLNLIYDGGVYISNACPNRMDPASTQVSPAEIDRIELVKGPYSVRYGQTMGGLINIITNQRTPVEHFGLSGELEGGYEVNGNGITGRGGFDVMNKKYDLLVQGGIIQFDDYKNGNGEAVPSAFKTSNYAVKIGINPNANQRLQLHWRQSFGKDIKHASLPMDSPKDYSSIISFDYGVRNTQRKLAEWNFKGYFSYVDHLMTNEHRPNYNMVQASAPIDSHTGGGRIEVGMNLSETSTLYTGLDLRSVFKDGVRNRKIMMISGNPLDPPKKFTDQIWQDSWLTDAGAFAETNITLGKRWSMQLGGRLDFVKSGAKEIALDFEELYREIDPELEVNFSVTTSFNYNYGQNGLVQLSLGRGTRAADLTERYINHFTVGMDAYEYVGDPNLKSEINNQLDFTVRNSHQQLSWSVNVFYSYLQNYITAIVDDALPRKYMPGTEPAYAKRFVNIDKAWQTGFDASVGYQFNDAFSAQAGAYYTFAENDDLDEPLAEIPPLTGLLSLKYERQTYWSEFKGRIVSGQDRVARSFDESETPGFTVFDLMAGYAPGDLFEVSFALRNIFDVYYYEHLSRSYKNQEESGIFSEPGRSFRLGLKFKF